MKTENLKKEILLTSNLIYNNTKMVIETATDIWSVTIYRKGWLRYWFNLGWKKKLYFWGFSGSARKLSDFLKDWLE